MWFIGVEVWQETSAPPPKINPGSVPDLSRQDVIFSLKNLENSTYLGLRQFFNQKKRPFFLSLTKYLFLI